MDPFDDLVRTAAAYALTVHPGRPRLPLLTDRSPLVTTWAAPRGQRTTTGRWPGPWATRPVWSYTGPTEQTAATTLYAVVTDLTVHRYRQGLSLRQLAARTGVAHSVLTSLEQGSTWPRLDTLDRVATALGRQVVVQATRYQQLRIPIADTTAVNQALIGTTRTWLRLGDRALARRTGLAHATITRLAHHPDTTSPTLPVLFALAEPAGLTLRVRPAPAWE